MPSFIKITSLLSFILLASACQHDNPNAGPAKITVTDDPQAIARFSRKLQGAWISDDCFSSAWREKLEFRNAGELIVSGIYHEAPPGDANPAACQGPGQPSETDGVGRYFIPAVSPHGDYGIVVRLPQDGSYDGETVRGDLVVITNRGLLNWKYGFAAYEYKEGKVLSKPLYFFEESVNVNNEGEFYSPVR